MNYNPLLKITISIITAIIFTISFVPQPSFASKDIAHEMKVLVNQEFYIPYSQQVEISGLKTYISGWDVNAEAGSVEQGLLIKDNSTSLPINLKKEFEQVDGSTLTIEFLFEFLTSDADTSFSLCMDDTAGVKIVANNGILYLEQQGLNPITLTSYRTGRNGVKAMLNLENKTVSIYLNGASIGNNLPFSNQISSLNNFTLKTGTSSTEWLNFHYLSIYRGYLINERFLTSDYALPPDWSKVENGGGVVGNTKFSNQGKDVFDLLLYNTPNGGTTYATRNVGAQTDHLVFESNIFFKKDFSNGALIKFKNGDTDIFGIKTNNNNQICYMNADESYTSFYNYTEDLWYRIKVDLDLPSSLAKVYFNGKLMAENISLKITPKQIDNLWIGVSNNSSSSQLEIDDILLYKYTAEPSDYVPTPQAVTSSNHLLGMQVCSLWTEGTHKGWDAINAVPERKPYLGFYDENNPEVSDWEIKYMVEHGINFQSYCWFRPIHGYLDPIKHAPNINGALHEGFFNAKYSNLMKFMIMWENLTYDMTGSDAQTDFENNIIPYWIEYYFKDPRYLKIDGRPVVSIYLYNLFVNQFGGVTNATTALQTLKTKCNNAGVGIPIIYASGSGIVGATTGAEMVNVGFEGVYKYNYNTPDYNMQKQVLEFERDENTLTGLEIIPTMSMGFNSFAWDNKASVIKNSPTEFASLLDWTKNQFIPSAPSYDANKKYMIIMASWNEFGEGHYLMPSKVHGFGYLDAIRSTFIGSSPHTDTIPNDAQKDRFNNLYVSERVVPLQIYYNPGLKTPPQDPSEYDLIHGWYFNTNNNFEGWGTVIDISDLTVNNGYLSGNASGPDPILISSYNLGYNISNVDFIKIKMSVNVQPIVDSATIYFITNNSTNWDENKAFYFPLGSDRSQNREYYIQVDRNSQWSGTLKQLRIDPMSSAVKFSGLDRNNFSIDSIELIHKK